MEWAGKKKRKRKKKKEKERMNEWRGLHHPWACV
jgi:hypothetical protein